MLYYAHSNDGQSGREWQLLKDHLINTGELTKRFANKFYAGEYGYFLGIMHDLGKYSEEFQKQLKADHLCEDHLNAGAVEAYRIANDGIGKILAYCIAGLHGDLPDAGSMDVQGSFNESLDKKFEPELHYSNEIDLSQITKLTKLPFQPFHMQLGFTISFFIRMLTSCLVDANCLDAENFTEQKNKDRVGDSNLEDLTSKFNLYIKNFKFEDAKMDQKRNDILNKCLASAKNNRGLFSLKLPNDSGKFIASLAFAFDHALKNNLDRIIYVVSDDSMMEINDMFLQNIFGDENVLEYHSNYLFEEKNDLKEEVKAISEKLELYSDNSDVPIIVTTNAVFFESLLSNKSAMIRKIHNIAKSVIITDEVEKNPVGNLESSLLSICELVKNYQSTVVLLSETNPPVSERMPLKPVEILEDMIWQNPMVKKVKGLDFGELDNASLIKKLNLDHQVLCIVHTKKYASKLYEKLEGENKYYLSTRMTPTHKKKVLKEIIKHLKRGEGCKVVSNQVIEGGMDLDFPIVYHFHDRADHLSSERIELYPKMRYEFEKEIDFDENKVLECFENGRRNLDFDFKTAADKFQISKGKTYSMIIPHDIHAKELIQEAEISKFSRSVLRKLQDYTVNIYEREAHWILENLQTRWINNRLLVLEDVENAYDNQKGLVFL
jgi:CRISPR-associated endonuclease Cas3-HD